MNWAEMVVVIVIACTVGGVLKARYGIRQDAWGNDLPPADTAETERMREEVRTLKERIQVLERLATDDSTARRLDSEIERLRDRT